MTRWKKDRLIIEVEKGGSEPPCPMCALPRVKRTDYIRCCRCATNWMDGEDIDRDPREERRNKFMKQAEMTRTSHPKPPAGEPGPDTQRRVG